MAVTLMDAKPGDPMNAAGTAAVSCVAETNVVTRRLPLNNAAVELTNPVPVRVRVKAGPPAETFGGVMLVRVSELVMVNGRVVPIPVTPTVGIPGFASRFADTVAVSCVDDRTWVASGAPFQVMALPEGGWNPVPVTVMVMAGLPAGAEFGVTLVMVPLMPLMEKVNPLDCRVAFWTVTLAVPDWETRLAGTVVESWVEETKVVGRVEPFH